MSDLRPPTRVIRRDEIRSTGDVALGEHRASEIIVHPKRSFSWLLPLGGLALLAFGFAYCGFHHGSLSDPMNAQVGQVATGVARVTGAELPRPALPGGGSPTSGAGASGAGASGAATSSTNTGQSDANGAAAGAGADACNAVDVFFDTNSTAIRAGEDSSAVERAATCLKKQPQTKVHIDGYADLRGEADYNARLAGNRAFAVAKELEHLGVPKSQLMVASHGKTGAGCQAGDVSCLAQNRRVSVALGR